MQITKDMAEVIMGAISVSQGEGIWGIKDMEKDDVNRYVYAEKELINLLNQLHPEIVKKYPYLIY